MFALIAPTDDKSENIYSEEVPMQSTHWLLILSGIVMAPVLLAACALLAGISQSPPEPCLNEEELGT